MSETFSLFFPNTSIPLSENVKPVSLIMDAYGTLAPISFYSGSLITILSASPIASFFTANSRASLSAPIKLYLYNTNYFKTGMDVYNVIELENVYKGIPIGNYSGSLISILSASSIGSFSILLI